MSGLVQKLQISNPAALQFTPSSGRGMGQQPPPEPWR
jgi:hypothetical protein